MKKILVAPDSFKGTLSSIEVSKIIASAIRSVFDECDVVEVPLADGGEGTAEVFMNSFNGIFIERDVLGPDFELVSANYAIIDNGKTAVIALSSASGLHLNKKNLSPADTTTFGTGQLIKDALDRGCEHIILGLGGSATNDLGIGILSALGINFNNSEEIAVVPTGRNLERIHNIDLSNIYDKFSSCKLTLATDVNNPLLGENGAAYVYAKQKGADLDCIQLLEKNAQSMLALILKDFNVDIDFPSAGAAGGVCGGICGFKNCELVSGIDYLLDKINFSSLLKDVDLVITGEGSIDKQSRYGKLLTGVSKLAYKESIPVIAVAGILGEGFEAMYDFGINAMFSITNQVGPFNEIKENSANNLYLTVQNIMKIIQLKK